MDYLTVKQHVRITRVFILYTNLTLDSWPKDTKAFVFIHRSTLTAIVLSIGFKIKLSSTSGDS